jgi:hypothetical protein
VAVRRLAVVSGDPGCPVLYVGRSRRQPPSYAVLTVTDSAQGVGGGIVQFVLKDGRVRCGLDVEQARANGRGLSSKLQSLAVSVRRR